ncbi:MAG: hypothetical protein JWR19_2547 [Pedosphaera sp.]|nr:hypothetical protein [Pedosphaera sp.]
MIKILPLLFLAVLTGCSPSITPVQTQMTQAQFAKLVATLGDNIQLLPRFADLPCWTNANASVILNYPNGKTVKEQVPVTAKTIDGKYVVFTAQSQLYQKPVDSILTYDEKASAFKTLGLYGDLVIENTTVYDIQKKIYAGSSTFGDGYTEITVGSFSDTQTSERTQVCKDGVLILTREITTVPVIQSK